MFIALPGLTLSINERDYFELVMETAMRGLQEFMAGQPLSVKIAEIEQPDVMLWAVWCIQQYAKDAGLKACQSRYGELLHAILSFIESGHHPHLTLKENGLVYTEGHENG